MIEDDVEHTNENEVEAEDLVFSGYSHLAQVNEDQCKRNDQQGPNEGHYIISNRKYSPHSRQRVSSHAMAMRKASPTSSLFFFAM
jgi:hypothetical protein